MYEMHIIYRYILSIHIYIDIFFSVNFMPAWSSSCKDHGGATALFIASQHGRLEAAKFLADKVAIDIPLNTNASPLYVACQNVHTQVVEVLLKAGANVNLETEDKATPLFIAAQMGHGAIVIMLLANGAEVEILNFTDASPLFIASQYLGFGKLHQGLDDQRTVFF